MAIRIRENRSFEIKYVAIRPDNIRDMANAFSGCVRTHEEENPLNDNELWYYASSFDGKQYTSDSVELFDSGGILDKDKIIHIKMRFSDRSTGNNATVDITHGNSSYTNKVEVSGTDSLWVRGTAKQLEDEVSKWEKHPDWPRRHYTKIANALAFAIGYVYVKIWGILFDIFGITKAIELLHLPKISVSQLTVYRVLAVMYIFMAGCYYIAGYYRSRRIMDYVQSLWPLVEFRCGYEYSHREKRIREYAFEILALIVIPTSMAAIYDMIKFLIK